MDDENLDSSILVWCAYNQHGLTRKYAFDDSSRFFPDNSWIRTSWTISENLLQDPNSATIGVERSHRSDEIKCVNTHKCVSSDAYAANEEPAPVHFETNSTVFGSSTLRKHVDMLRAMGGFGRDRS